MLNAILKGKSRPIPKDVAPGASLREVFKKSEDALTASVFERLGYLSGQTVWQILGLTFGMQNFPARQVVKLDSIEFWPKWTEARDRMNIKVEQMVEPDVLLRLSVGDPARKVALIVECKLKHHYSSTQLINEWNAYLVEYEDEPVDEIWVLCIGGSLDEAQRSIAALNEAEKERGDPVNAAAAAWQQMLAAVEAVEAACSGERRALLDTLAALRLYGFWQFRPMSELCSAPKRRTINPKTAETLRWPSHV
jgi:hypothetical protein